jgi:hypothetical protein
MPPSSSLSVPSVLPLHPLINIDPRSHLELADFYHRYAKNLRLYFKEYTRLFGLSAIREDTPNTTEGLRQRFQSFFNWLDNIDEVTKLKPEVKSIIEIFNNFC